MRRAHAHLLINGAISNHGRQIAKGIFVLCITSYNYMTTNKYEVLPVTGIYSYMMSVVVHLFYRPALLKNNNRTSVFGS